MITIIIIFTNHKAIMFILPCIIQNGTYQRGKRYILNMAASNKSDGLDVGFGCKSGESTAAIPFNIISIRAQYIPRIGQLRIEQSLATEERPTCTRQR
jgi:hypothetical protein